MANPLETGTAEADAMVGVTAGASAGAGLRESKRLRQALTNMTNHAGRGPSRGAVSMTVRVRVHVCKN